MASSSEVERRSARRSHAEVFCGVSVVARRTALSVALVASRSAMKYRVVQYSASDARVITAMLQARIANRTNVIRTNRLRELSSCFKCLVSA